MTILEVNAKFDHRNLAAVFENIFWDFIVSRTSCVEKTCCAVSYEILDGIKVKNQKQTKIIENERNDLRLAKSIFIPSEPKKKCSYSSINFQMD